jgi:hypothetical protein
MTGVTLTTMRLTKPLAILLAAVSLTVTGAVFTAAVSPAPASAKAHVAKKKKKRTHRVAKMLWGLVTMPDGSDPIPIYKKLGVKYFEYQLVWSRIATSRPANAGDPNDPAYHWSKQLDNFVAEANANGIQVAFMLKDTPDWANGGAGQAVPATSDGDYAAFAAAAARHFPTVHRWMIWGEANRSFNWQPEPANSPVAPRRYATMLNAAYYALKAVSKKNKVIGGMTFTFGDVHPVDWVRWMRLPNGKRPPLDYFGHNPFTRRKPGFHQPISAPGARDMSDVPKFAREVHKAYKKVRRFRKRGPSLWLSEFTVSSDRANRAFNFAVSRAQQAAWLRSAFKISDRTRAVAALGWFNLIDEGPSIPNGLTTGLLDANGQPKPVFNVFQKAH